MAGGDGFKTYIVDEVFSGIDGISTRSMFGGFGIYRHGVFFALIANGVLYFKVDETNRKDYIDAGMKPFVYTSPKGKHMTMKYYEVPEDVMNSPEEIRIWVEKSYAVAVHAKK